MSTTDLFWDAVCSFRRLLLIGLALDIVFLLINSITIPFILAGSIGKATTVVTVVNFLVGGGLAIAILYVYRRCRDHV